MTGRQAGHTTTLPTVAERFLTPQQVREELAISQSQLYALIRRNDLVAVKIGGRGEWRIERSELEAFIARTYTDTAQWIAEHPFAGGDEEDGS